MVCGNVEQLTKSEKRKTRIRHAEIYGQMITVVISFFVSGTDKK